MVMSCFAWTETVTVSGRTRHALYLTDRIEPAISYKTGRVSIVDKKAATLDLDVIPKPQTRLDPGAH